MNYSKIYNNLVESRQGFNRKKVKSDGLERHHIIPRSLGGSNLKENLVYLTPKEHYIAHLLLIKIHTGKDKSKMIYAFAKMNQCNPKQLRDKSQTSRGFALARRLMSAHCSGDNHFGTGKTVHTEETITKLRERMSGSNNPSFGKPAWNRGKKGYRKHTEESKRQMSKRHTGKTLSDEAKRKVSEAQRGRIKSQAHRDRISATLKGRPRSQLSDQVAKARAESLRGTTQTLVQCPHCLKEGGYTSMHRWHMDNCRTKRD